MGKRQVGEVAGLAEGRWEVGNCAGGRASHKRVADGGKTACLSSSWIAGSDSPRWTCTSWWWTCPLCSWWAEGEGGGVAEEVELHEVEEELLVSLIRQRLRGLFRWAGQGQRGAACDQEEGSPVEEASGSPVSVF